MKIAFDIGGTISRYPTTFIRMMKALQDGGVEVFILTDMNNADAMKLCEQNDIDFIDESRILSADWNTYGDLCKSRLMQQHSIDILIDDRPDYCATGPFIGLVLSP